MEDLKFILKEFIPDGAFMDKFGLFYARNGTDYVDGVWNMFTGKENNHNMGKVHSWNYSTESFFPGKCGRVKGGAGEFYPPRNVLCLVVTKILMNINKLIRNLDILSAESTRETFMWIVGNSLIGKNIQRGKMKEVG